MSRRTKPFPTWDLDKDFVIADRAARAEAVAGMDRAARKQWETDEAPRWLAWNAVPTAAQRKNIRALRLRVDGNVRSLEPPVALSTLSALRFLSMPLGMAAKLRPGTLPDSLEALDLDEDTGGIATLAPDLELPNVRWLSSITGELRFVRENLPRLASVSLHLGARTKMLDVLGSCKRLTEVELDAVHGIATLAPLNDLRLSSLSIVGGRIATLEGIDAFPSLEGLLLKNLRKLNDISAAAALSRLESLEIQYCGEVADLKPILELPRLERLTIVSCNRIRLAEVVDALRGRPWKELAITGKRHRYKSDEGDGRWIVSTR